MVLSSSALVVLSVGNGLGAAVKGLTGFGSAILNLCVWVVAKTAGLDSGTLQQAVLSECIASELVAFPMLWLTCARATADWRLVTALAIFTAVGAPLGAACLAFLPARKVEAAMGSVLLVIICLHCKLPQQLSAAAAACLARRRAHKQPAAATLLDGKLPASQADLAVLVDCCCNSSDGKQGLASAHAGCVEPVTAEVWLPARAASKGASSGFSRRGSAELAAAPEWPADGLGGREQQEPVQLHPQRQPQLQAGDEESACLLPPGAASSSPAQADAASSKPPACGRGAAGLVQRMWARHCGTPEQRRALAQVFGWGSLAGVAGGLLAGMTGMGGPPAMLLFEALAVPKEVVRGTNAVLNVLQFRIVAYLLLGEFVACDWRLYLSASLVSVAGMLAGNRLAAGINQAQFSRTLVGLMVLCCALMFASAAGVVK